MKKRKLLLGRKLPLFLALLIICTIQGMRVSAKETDTDIKDDLEKTIVEGMSERKTEIDLSGYGLSRKEAEQYVELAVLDNPKLFFVKDYKIKNSSADAARAGFVCNIVYIDAAAAKQRQAEMDAAAAEAVSFITEDMEDYEKALVIHDWLAHHCSYDDRTAEESDTAYGAFVNCTASDRGIAQAYVYLMKEKLGIPCFVVCAGSHAWNIVFIGGRYYHVDVSSDDDDWGLAGHDYILLSDAGIRKQGHNKKWYGRYDFKADDTFYENALWREASARSSIVYHKGLWYFAADDELSGVIYQTDNIVNGEKQQIYKSEQNGYPFCLRGYRDWLVFNGYQNGVNFIGSMFLDTGEIATVNADWLKGIIYQIQVEGDQVHYRTDADEESFLDVPGKRVVGTAALRASGDNSRYGGTMTAWPRVEGQYGTPYYRWYRDGILVQSKTDRTASRYELGKDDIGTAITVKIVYDGYVGSLEAGPVIVRKAKPRLPDMLPKEMSELKGIKGGRLEDVALPDGYAWKNPGTRLEHLGQRKYAVTYCPDSDLYETIDLEDAVTILVECDHDWVAGTKVAATCTKAGYTPYKCSICKATKKKKIKATNKHTWDSGKITKEPTKTGAGVFTNTCTMCQRTKTETVVLATIYNLKTSSSFPKGKLNVRALPGYSGQVIGSLKNGDVVKALVESSDSEWTAIYYSNKKAYVITRCVKEGIAEKKEDSGEDEAPKKGDSLTSGGALYKVTQSGSTTGTLAFVKPAAGTKTVTIPAVVQVGKISYKVTSIADEALKGNRKVTKVIIGSNVTKIGREAFYGCRKLKNITIRSSGLKSVGTKAIGNINRKAKISCPKKKKRDYQKLFTKRTGYKKTMSIK